MAQRGGAYKQTNKQMDGRTDGQKISPFYRTLTPIGTAAQKSPVWLCICLSIHLSVSPSDTSWSQGPKNQPARSQYQPARPKTHPARPQTQPARPHSQPTRPQSQTANHIKEPASQPGLGANQPASPASRSSNQASEPANQISETNGQMD